jgi:uncharacterized SAM-binding protein YcdF (DUF218 family)
VITILPSNATSTWDEALILRDYVVETDVRRIIVVTTGVHTRRARWLFRRALSTSEADLMFSGVEDPRYELDTWWRSEAGLIAVTNEYLKLFHNSLARRRPKRP